MSKSDIRTETANELIILDQNLFWRGSGAIIVPQLNKDKRLEKFIVKKGGKGFSSQVHAYVSGAGSQKFELGPVLVKDGSILSIPIKESSKWHNEPLVYVFDEKDPFSGIVESQFPSGQLIEQTPYLSGKVHGTMKGWNEHGIPLYSKDYLSGKKHGTHIFWFEQTNDPDDYKPLISPTGEIFPTLWIKLREDAKDKFGNEFSSHKANEWVTFNYRRNGGDFPVRLLEHWKDNVRHGLFEGFDKLGNKTFKDDYKMGLRIKHKTFDKTKGRWCSRGTRTPTPFGTRSLV